MDAMVADGFAASNWFLAAHSLGGVMTQDFLNGYHHGFTPDGLLEGADPALFQGQILMSSALTRDKRSIQEDGMSLFTTDTPTLTIGGSKDGLMRITRIAESYWHQITNITPSQSNFFPVEVLEGVSHYQFAGGVPPSFVQDNDLRADVADADARTMVGQTMTTFIDQVLNTGLGATT